MNLKKLIKEVLYSDCCKATKPTKAPILNENLAPREILSEGLKYHIDNNKPLTEHVYRAGSENYFNLWAEARSLYVRGILDFSGDDLSILTETNLGEFGIIYEIKIGDKVKASKEYGGLSGEVVDIRGSFIIVKTKEGNQSYHESDLRVLNKEGKKVPLDFPMLEEQENPTEFNINKVWDFIESRPFYNKNYMPKFNTAEEIWDEWGSEERQMYAKFNWKDTYGDKLHRRELQNLQRRKNYDNLAGLTESKTTLDSETIKQIKADVNSFPKYQKRGFDSFKKEVRQRYKITPKQLEDILSGDLTESKKENKPIGKPMRSSSGGKAYKVYVRDPKTKKIKTVRFGSGGLKAKINNPKARQAFAKRHDCKNKKDRTKPSYWSCRLPSYAKLLGLKSNFSGFW